MGFSQVLVLLLIAVVGTRSLSHIVFTTRIRYWMASQRQCRENHFDLISMDTPKKLELFLNSSVFKNVTADTSPNKWDMAWIGLSRESGSEEWLWSDTGEKLSNENLIIQYDNNWPDNQCVAVSKDGTFHARRCETQLPRFCYYTDHGLGPVGSNMTWSNALSYCRGHFKDIASLANKELLQSAVGLVQGEGKGELVWIGLWYVRRYWLWMSGDALEFQAWEGGQRYGPQCPEPRHYCGALNVTSSRWVNVDCEKELPVLCQHWGTHA